MLLITMISVTERASPLLFSEWARFRPRYPGEVFGMAYTSSLINADGTTPSDFRPGYSRHSVDPEGLSDIWARAVPTNAQIHMERRRVLCRRPRM
jgi:hypothetical protein